MAFDEVVYEKRLTEVEARSKSNTKRIDELAEEQKAIQTLADSVNKLATKQEVAGTKMEAMSKSVDEIKGDVKSLKAVPAAKWNSLVDRIWQIALGIIIGYLAVKVGLG